MTLCLVYKNLSVNGVYWNNRCMFWGPRSKVLLEKLTGSQLVNKFPTFCGTRKFITAFTSARHLSVSWARSIQSMPPHHTYWWDNLILSCHLCLGLPCCLFPSGFPTNTLCAPLLYQIYAIEPTHLSLLYLVTLIIFDEKYTVCAERRIFEY